jgi:hypothetical protein
MTNTVFWDITPCSSLKVNRRFGLIYRLHPKRRKNRSRYQHEGKWQMPACHILPRLYFSRLIRHWRWRRYVPPKRWLTSNGLHGVISQKIKRFTIYLPLLISSDFILICYTSYCWMICRSQHARHLQRITLTNSQSWISWFIQLAYHQL